MNGAERDRSPFPNYQSEFSNVVGIIMMTELYSTGGPGAVIGSQTAHSSSRIAPQNKE